MDISVSGSRIGKKYYGAGMVSANNSSRLLLDYKYEHEKEYKEILEHIFGSNGVCVNHLKLEMGADINSSSGTEPCVKRYENEPADVTRGAGYILAADAKKINPDLTLDILFWSEPKWVTDSEDTYAAGYKWYKETLCAAYDTYGLKFDYVSVSRNERDIDGEWIKYFSRKIKSESDCPYDFSKIKIVAADEENSWRISDLMINDEELRNAVDVVGTHYTSHCTDNTRRLSDEFGKEVWFTEGSPPMTYSKGTSRFDGSGLSGINGVLDIANRIVAMYPCGCMSLYEYQPVVSAYYDGVTYCHKQLITANEPWSGFYSLDSGYYMSLHFSRFIKKDWRFVDGACYCDGKKGGDGHALIDTVYSYMTACDTETGDYSTVIVNSTEEPIEYNISVSLLKKASAPVNVWETRGSDSGEYDSNYFKKISVITPDENDGKYAFSVTVKPFSMVTVSTLDTVPPEIPTKQSHVLSLPYCDDFSYGDYNENYLTSRGMTPRYTTDQGGAFEVAEHDGKNVLMQMITPDIKAMEWGFTPPPTTTFGDDRWYNYQVSADVGFSKSNAPDENYVGIGLRYSHVTDCMCGYSLLIYEDGSWRFCRNNDTKLSGSVNIDKLPVNIRISAEHDKITGYIDSKAVFEYYADQYGEALIGAGRAALYSSYNRNYYENVEISPVGETPYITRFDDTDDCFEYGEGWTHNLMSGFSDYRRTVSTGSEGAELVLKFIGNGFGIFGANDGNCVILASVDGSPSKSINLPLSASREIVYSLNGLVNTEHTVKITVVSGILNVDGVQIEGEDI